MVIVNPFTSSKLLLKTEPGRWINRANAEKFRTHADLMALVGASHKVFLISLRTRGDWYPDGYGYVQGLAEAAATLVWFRIQ